MTPIISRIPRYYLSLCEGPKVMATSEGRDHTFTCIGEAIEQVESFRYLGAVITSTGDSSVEIRSRVGIARSALTSLEG